MSLALYGIARNTLRRRRFRGFEPATNLGSLDLRAVPVLVLFFSEDCPHCREFEQTAIQAIRDAAPGKRRLLSLSRQDAEDEQGAETATALLALLDHGGFSVPPQGGGYQVPLICTEREHALGLEACRSLLRRFLLETET